MPEGAEDHELAILRDGHLAMEAEEAERLHDDIEGALEDEQDEHDVAVTEEETTLNRRTLRKLDFILLPFLALLFLLNSLDKSNIGNAETAGFTKDAGLTPADLNYSLAFFFAFFVALQPLGAALGRKYGMARWVPACMSLWGLCTILHIWVRSRWQLVCLRIAIASLEAGFYPTTVSYLSLFYTRYEFALRLGIFYGQTAVAGVVGGVLSWAVFRQFPSAPDGPQLPPTVTLTDVTILQFGAWKSWKVLFLIEGIMTIAVALLGFFWLPHSADTAWFFTKDERVWAERRIRVDRATSAAGPRKRKTSKIVTESTDGSVSRPSESGQHLAEDYFGEESHHRLLASHSNTHPPMRRLMSTVSTMSVTADTGLSRHDVLSAILNYKIWHLLVCNILSAIPATAFSVFLPLVIKQLSPSLNLSPAASNLLSAPPFACGAVTLLLFTTWSDRTHQRLTPIFAGLGLLLLGLLLTVLAPMKGYVLRYLALCILLSGSFIASPLTVAWLTNNTPEPGKRAILLGINGWGNLAGVFSALLFTPEEGDHGYTRSFIVTLVAVVGSFAGFIAFWVLVVRENAWRERIMSKWTEEEREQELVFGDMEVPRGGIAKVIRRLGVSEVMEKIGMEEARRGDDKLTFRYGL